MPISPSSSAPTDATTQGILLVEGYDALAVAIASALKKFAPLHTIRVARTLGEAEAAATEMRPELFVLDLDPAPAGDVDFLVKLQSRCPEARVLVIASGVSRELRAERGTAGAVQFIDKPFDLGEFGAAVQALLGPWAIPPSDSFRGTLRDLHVVDIVQLKCLALSSAVVRLGTPSGQAGEIHFHHGQISHAVTGRLSGLAALQEIVRWRGGRITESKLPDDAPKTIPDQPWAVLLLEAVRKTSEHPKAAARKTAGAAPPPPPPPPPAKKPGKTILVIDDTEMLLIFAADVLATANSDFEVVTALMGREGLKLAASLRPDLILLDYSLMDMTGADVCRGLLMQEATARIPVLMMSGHLPELANTAAAYGNVVTTLPKPFLSGALI
ncbi:MAG: response regulator, partial [Chthoniobacterales bacterium]